MKIARKAETERLAERNGKRISKLLAEVVADIRIQTGPREQLVLQLIRFARAEETDIPTAVALMKCAQDIDLQPQKLPVFVVGEGDACLDLGSVAGVAIDGWNLSDLKKTWPGKT